MKKPNYCLKTLTSFDFKADVVLVITFWFGFCWYQHAHGNGILDTTFVAILSIVVCYFEEWYAIKQGNKQ